MFGEKEQGIYEAKRDLQRFLIEEVERKGNGITDNAFIIFVDDLDRLNPGLAVTLLEAMKNLVDMEKCFFVLAIDSDVVSCGIQVKYGQLQLIQLNLEHDFFDKLVQMPFVMPIADYNLAPMVMERLREIKFFSTETDYKKYECMIDEIVTLATNKNPRATKRLLNLTQLMIIIQRSKSQARHHPAFCMLEFLLMALQLSFPEVYEMVAQNSDFESWASKYRAAHSNVAITDIERDEYNLDASWKEAVFMRASQDDYMRRNFYRISCMLTLYEDFEQRCEKAGESVSEILGIVSVVCRRAVDGIEMKFQFQGASYDEHSATQFSQGALLIDSLDLTKYGYVLDVGCGNGKTKLELSSRNPDMKVDAFDIESSQIEIAQGHWADYLSAEGDGVSGSVTFSVMDVLDLNAQNEYELVFSNATLHWIADQERVYTLIYNALVPGGDLAVHQGGKDTYEELHEVARRAISSLGLDDKYKDWKFPALYATKEYVQDILTKVGFISVTVDYDVKDESDSATLVEDFANASLPQYKIAGVSKADYKRIAKEYHRICAEESPRVFSRRLYIHARKPE